MGYDITRFTGEVDEEFHCSICSMVLENPVQTPCDHSFCHDCITEWLTLNAVCPQDRNPVRKADLKPPSRIIRNFLAKLRIKCDFRLEGCTQVGALEHLQDHLTSCKFNPNSETICDKGCNLRMKRREYDANNCLVHFSNRVASREREIISQEKEIIRLTHEMSNQKEYFERALDRQRQDYQRALNHQKDENRKLKDEVKGAQVKIKQLNLIPKQIEIKKRPLKWQEVEGMKISTDELNILEGTPNGTSFAQLCYPLDSSNSSFKVQIIEHENMEYYNARHIEIGLSSSPKPHNESIMYNSHGHLYGGGFNKRSVPKLQLGDIIECGIDYTYNFNIDGTYNVELYFYKNGEFILKELVKMPIGGFYPYVSIYNSCGKIKYLAN